MKIKQTAPIAIGKILLPMKDYHNSLKAAMPISQYQENFVKEFNKKVDNGEIEFESVPCLCGNNVFDLLASIDRYAMKQNTVICTKCGLIQSNPRMSEDAFQKFYSSDAYRKCYESDNFEQIYLKLYNVNYGKHIFDEINNVRKIGKGIKILEFGAGGGWNLLPFMEAGADVLGMDYSPQLVKLGQKHGINMIQGGLDNIEGKYDVIIVNHVFEHLINPIYALNIFISHLLENGCLYIAVPNIMNFDITQLQNAHTYYFTPKTLEYYCSSAGLKVISQGKAENIHMFAIFKPSKEKSKSNFALEKNYKEFKKLLIKFIFKNYIKKILKSMHLLKIIKNIRTKI